MHNTRQPSGTWSHLNRIDADLSGKTVTLTYRKPDGSTLNRTVTTGPNGAYSGSYALKATGSWSVSASWEGDLTHAGATSLSRSITVTPKPFLETPLGMGAAGVSVIVVVLVVVLLRRKEA
jgi:hypothetical protein